MKDFVLKEGQLYYVAKADKKHKLVITKDKIQSIMKICHEESGHLGINKTMAKVVESYYWIGIVKDVTSYIKHCQECQHQNKDVTSYIKHCQECQHQNKVIQTYFTSIKYIFICSNVN